LEHQTAQIKSKQISMDRDFFKVFTSLSLTATHRPHKYPIRSWRG